MTNIAKPPCPQVPNSIKYPFSKMKPGDYELIEFKTDYALSIAQRCAHTTTRKNGYKFVTRKNGLTLQIWCIEKPAAVDPFFGE